MKPIESLDGKTQSRKKRNGNKNSVGKAHKS